MITTPDVVSEGCFLLEDPRGRPYLVFWVTDEGSLRYPLHMARIDGGAAVAVTTPSGMRRRIELVWHPSANRTGSVILYRRPICKKPRRLPVPAGGKRRRARRLLRLALSGVRPAPLEVPGVIPQQAGARTLRRPGGNLRGGGSPNGRLTVPLGSAGGVRSSDRRR